jgi:hypothetical protein
MKPRDPVFAASSRSAARAAQHARSDAERCRSLVRQTGAGVRHRTTKAPEVQAPVHVSAGPCWATDTTQSQFTLRWI